MEEEIIRVRIPRQGEVFGVIVENYGSSRLRVMCSDGKSRIVRIPGKLRRRVWAKAGDYIIVHIDDIQGEEKGELVWKYAANQVDYLKRQGYLKNL